MFSQKTAKMESRDETNELQQLVSSDVENEGDDIAQDSYTVSRDEKIISPVRSTKVTISQFLYLFFIANNSSRTCLFLNIDCREV